MTLQEFGYLCDVVQNNNILEVVLGDGHIVTGILRRTSYTIRSNTIQRYMVLAIISTSCDELVVGNDFYIHDLDFELTYNYTNFRDITILG